jgi:hypothetical protein
VTTLLGDAGKWIVTMFAFAAGDSNCGPRRKPTDVYTASGVTSSALSLFGRYASRRQLSTIRCSLCLARLFGWG